MHSTTASPLNANDKKRQTALKKCVKQFGETLVQWKSYEAQLAQQISYQLNITSANQSVSRALSSRDTFLCHAFSAEIDLALEQRLFSRLSAELSSSLNLIYEALKAMDELVAVFKLKAEESNRLILNQPFSSVSPNLRDDLSQVIELQDLTQMLSLEFDRKVAVINEYTSELLQKFDIRCTIDSKSIEQRVRDTSSLSFLDHWRVEAFLLQNNIGNSMS